MLVLSRKAGQRICIEPGIEIVVIAVQGQRVQIGVVAPQDIAIRREELPPDYVAPQFRVVAKRRPNSSASLRPKGEHCASC